MKNDRAPGPGDHNSSAIVDQDRDEGYSLTYRVSLVYARVETTATLSDMKQRCELAIINDSPLTRRVTLCRATLGTGYSKLEFQCSSQCLA